MMQETPRLDISEKGKDQDGNTVSMDRRLFMQFLAFGNCHNTEKLTEALTDAKIDAALYIDINDPYGVGLLTFSEDPDFFITKLRKTLNKSPFIELTPKPEYTMLGRTYAIGYETDLEETLVTRPRRKVLDPAWSWAVWYPLRRAKSFETLPERSSKLFCASTAALASPTGGPATPPISGWPATALIKTITILWLAFWATNFTPFPT